MKLRILKSELQTLVKAVKIYPVISLAILIATVFSIMEIWKVKFNVLNGTLIVDLIISSLYFAMSYMIVELIVTGKNIEITSGQKTVAYATVFVIVGLLCYFLIIKVDKSLYFKNQITQMGLFSALFIGMFIAGHFNAEIDYTDYAVKIVLAIIESLIYCVTIFVGIVAILYATKELSKLNFNLSNLIATCVVVVFLLLDTAIILSKFPLKHCKENLKIEWLTPFKFLFTRIIAPLFLTYGSILLLYIIKVVVLKTIPNSITTNLILRYGLLSVVILFVSKAIEDKFMKICNKIQPIMLLILSDMVLYSVGIRISYYGITERRYMVMIGGVFIVISMIHYLFFSKRTYVTIPTTLLILTLISSAGPASMYNISKIDQRDRLEKMLIEENLLVNGEMKPQKNINPAKIEKVKGKLNCFTRKHSAKELAYLDEKFTTSEINIKRVSGFRGDEFESLHGKNRFYANNKLEIDTTGCDRLLENIVFEYDFTNQSINNTGSPEVTFSKKSNVVIMQYKGKRIGKLNIETFRNKLEDFRNERGPDIDIEDPNSFIVDEGVTGGTKYKTILERVDSLYDSRQKVTY